MTLFESDTAKARVEGSNTRNRFIDNLSAAQYDTEVSRKYSSFSISLKQTVVVFERLIPEELN